MKRSKTVVEQNHTMEHKTALILVSVAASFASADLGLGHVVPVHHAVPVVHAAPVVHTPLRHAKVGYGEPVYANTPPNYGFDYAVHDEYAGTNFGHSEAREGYRTEGKYFVHLPDGRIQTVTYYADETGYHPTVTYEGTAAYGVPAKGYGVPQPGYH